MSVDENTILSTLSLEEIEALAEKKRQMVQEAEEQRLLDQIAELDQNLELLAEKRRLYETEKEKLARKLADLRGEQVFTTLDDYRARIRSEANRSVFDRVHEAFAALASGKPNFNKGYIAYGHRNKFVGLRPRGDWLLMYFPKRVQLHEFLAEEVREALGYHQHPDGKYERVYLSARTQEHLDELVEALRKVIAERPAFHL
jgi:hypothetical protein